MGAKRYLRVESVESARRLLMERLGAGWGNQLEEVPAAEAQGRILARPVEAIFCSPAYHASAMDGFALDAAKSFSASEHRPVDLAVGTEALPVDTGDPLPPGTNAVLMVEDAHYHGQAIRIYRSVSPFENVRMMGEDIVAGEMILPEGKIITPYDIGLCLAGGRTSVVVRRRPRLGIIPTGDELIGPGRAPRTGEIVEFNSTVLAELCRERGAEPVVWPIIPDRAELVRGGAASALESVDILVINAGSSAGRDDHTATIIREMGELLVHGVAMVPGKPTALGIIEGTPVVGLPGYPASAIISFEQFVFPLIDRFLGWEAPDRRIRAAISRDLPSRPGHAEFVRGQAGMVAGRMVFNPLPRGAGLISSYARANSLAEIPPESEGVGRGEEVAVRPLVPREELGRSVLLAGSHDLCLDLLREELLRGPARLNLMVSTQGSLGGLIMLGDGYAHVATCHLLDPATGSYNLPYLERLLPGREMVIIRVAHREQGLIVGAGNPKGIRSLADLAREDVAYVNRQRGSGTRILLDYLLGIEHIRPEAVRGYAREEITHLSVAAAISGGLADAGMGVHAAARALGLEFIPLEREPFDLVIPDAYAGEAFVERLRGIVESTAFRTRLESLGGYDVSRSGRIR